MYSNTPNMKILLISLHILVSICFADSTSYISVKNDQKPTTGEIRFSKNNSHFSIELAHTDIKVEINGALARVNTIQKFVNDSTSIPEAYYYFPISTQDMIDSFDIYYGDKHLTRSLTKLDELKKMRHTLDKNHAFNPFQFLTSKLVHIAPNDTITVKTSFEQKLPYASGKFIFEYPLKSSAATERLPRDKYDLNIVISKNTPILSAGSPTHKITQQHKPAQLDISFENMDNIPNKDFVLRYKVAGNDIKPSVYHQRVERKNYFQLLLTPILEPYANQLFKREIIFVVDNTKSMQGEPLETASKIMTNIVENMTDDDVYRVARFSDKLDLFSKKPLDTHPKNLRSTLKFINEVHTVKKSKRLKGLDTLFNMASENRQKIILFLTDGNIKNERQILKSVRKNKYAMITTIGLGKKVNHQFLNTIAEQGKGEYFFISPNKPLEEKLEDINAKIHPPIINNIQITSVDFELENILPRKIPNINKNTPVIITGKINKGRRGTIRVSGDRPSGHPWKINIALDITDDMSSSTLVHTFWAKEIINHLQQNKKWGYNTLNSQEYKKVIESLSFKTNIPSEFAQFVTNYSNGQKVKDSLVHLSWKAFQVKNQKEYATMNPIEDIPAVSAKSDTLRIKTEFVKSKISPVLGKHIICNANCSRSTADLVKAINKQLKVLHNVVDKYSEKLKPESKLSFQIVIDPSGIVSLCTPIKSDSELLEFDIDVIDKIKSWSFAPVSSDNMMMTVKLTVNNKP